MLSSNLENRTDRCFLHCHLAAFELVARFHFWKRIDGLSI